MSAGRPRRRQRRIVAGPLRPLVHVIAFVRKDVVTVLRQPRLLLVLVAGPFVLLLLFALGYDQESTVLRTVFVGPPDQGYEQSVDEISSNLTAYITSEGYSTDRGAAERQLADGKVDLVVVFPPDPTGTVLAGDHAVVTVLHNKLDPIQQTAVQVSSRVAVQELNAEVLQTIVADLQQEIKDRPGLDQALQTTGSRAPASDGSRTGQVIDARDQITTIDPAVVARPFVARTENILRVPVTVNDFLAPAAIALLVQHMALTFAAMSLVRDRDLGLFELLRVGPVGPGRIILGKYLAHLLVSSVLGAALLAAVTYGVGVPMRGHLWWVAAGILGVVTASVTMGMVLSLLARSDTQAVQYAMLVLLAGLFFGGFLIDLGAVRYPFKAVSLVLPVTYGTRLLRDVMLRGADPQMLDLVGLAATSIVFAALSWLLLARRLRLE